ncbi:MAG TPA: hypothetical protein VNQ52_10040 [Microbacteriaceae bacterium]|nr:hypothetical protein [Microbacteriaceae bacterium]
MGQSTDDDRRGLVLVSPGLELVEVEDWAERFGYRIEHLPEPGYRAHPDADAAQRRRLGRQDAGSLVALLRGVKSELRASARIVALLVADEDVSGQAGRAWLRRLEEAAERVGVALPRPARFTSDGRFDATRLERRILAEAE